MPLMHSHTLDKANRGITAGALASGDWIVACLCAGWCGTCSTYRATFETLAARHPDKHFVWIDIEDQADVVGDLDVDNFPTLLLQKNDVVAFFGTMLPDPALAERLIQSKAGQTNEELAAQRNATWQSQCNLRELLANAA